MTMTKEEYKKEKHKIMKSWELELISDKEASEQMKVLKEHNPTDENSVEMDSYEGKSATFHYIKGLEKGSVVIHDKKTNQEIRIYAIDIINLVLSELSKRIEHETNELKKEEMKYQ